MKSKLFFLPFLVCAQAIAQQTSVTGIVSIFNSETQTGKRQYVSNAQVEDEFDKAQPVVTNAYGQFRLIYTRTGEKESVSFQIKKPDLQVVNTDALSAIQAKRR